MSSFWFDLKRRLAVWLFDHGLIKGYHIEELVGMKFRKVYVEKCFVCGKQPCRCKWDDGDGVYYFCSCECLKKAKNELVPK